MEIKYPIHLKAIDAVWSEIYDNEYHTVCEVKTCYAQEVFDILNTRDAALDEIPLDKRSE